MLSLKRKEGQSIVIDGNVIVRILSVKSHTVKVGVEAPPAISIYREEIAAVGWRGEDLFLPATEQLAAVVQGEVERAGGNVIQSADNGRALYVKATLPEQAEVRPKDVVEAGIAVRVVGEDIAVHRYVLRRVCVNGAIMTQEAQSRRIARAGFAADGESIDRVLGELREALRAVYKGQGFRADARRIRAAILKPADPAKDLNPRLSGLPRHVVPRLQVEIMRRFRQGGDPTLFALMNAVTSVARDTGDPCLRWRLEELGGAILDGQGPAARPGLANAELVGATL
jgi:carbon storage regulator